MKKRLLTIGVFCLLCLTGCAKEAKQQQNDPTGTQVIVTSQEIETESVKPKESELVTETHTEETSGIQTEQIKETEEKGVEESTGHNISNLKFDGKNILDVTATDMKQYDYVKDVYIEVDEDERKVSITIQVPQGTDNDTVEMAGEDVARYLAFMASNTDSYFAPPGSKDIGGIYNKYSLLLYIDDGNKTIDKYGAKVTTSPIISWR